LLFVLSFNLHRYLFQMRKVIPSIGREEGVGDIDLKDNINFRSLFVIFLRRA